MSAIILHPFRNNQVFRAVVTSHSARHAVLFDGLLEEVEDCLRAIVVVDAESGDHVRFAIDKAMHDNFEPYEACGWVRGSVG